MQPVKRQCLEHAPVLQNTALPDDLWKHASSFIPTDSIDAFFQVSKQFHSPSMKAASLVGRTEVIQRMLRDARYDTTQLPPELFTKAVRMSLTELRLEGKFLSYDWFQHEIPEDLIISCIQMFPKIQKLVILDLPNKPEKAVDAISQLNHLRTLNVVTSGFDDQQFMKLCSMSLEELTFSASKGNEVTSSGLAAGLDALSKSQNLQRLNLLFLKNVTDEVAFSIAQIPTLRVLGIYRPTLTTVGLQALWTLPNLEEIDLEYFKATDQTLTDLAKMKTLKSINLMDCLNITAEGVKELAKLPKLEKLRLTRHHCIRLDIFEDFPSLRELNLGYYVYFPKEEQVNEQRLKQKKPDLRISEITYSAY